GLRHDRMDHFRRRFRDIGTLIVDDVEFFGGKVRSQGEFLHTFNALYDERKPAEAGMVLDPAVVRYLATHRCDNVRQLEGAIARIDAFATLTGRAVTP